MASNRTQLTVAMIKAADAARQPARLLDTTKGLTFVVGARGGTWQWQGKIDKKVTKVRGGRFEEGRGVTLAAARAWADDINARIGRGENPFEKNEAPSNDAAIPVSNRRVMTCQEAWTIHLQEAQAAGDNTDRTLIDKRQTWDRLFASAIGEKLLTDVTYLELADIVDPLKAVGKRAAFNNAVRYVKRFFTWAEEAEARTGLSDSPARRLKTDKPNSRDRFLNEIEVRWLWDAVEELDATSRAYFLVVLLTGQRRDEISKLVRDEVDMSRLWIDLPEARMKTGVAHVVPFGDKTRDLIAGRLAAHNFRYVFPSPRSYIAEASYSDYDLGNALNLLNSIMEGRAKASELSYNRWTAHDLRRTFSTLANAILDDNEDTVLDENHIERVLSHKVGGKVSNTYNKHQYIKEKRRVLKVWEDEVRRIVGNDAFERY